MKHEEHDDMTAEPLGTEPLGTELQHHVDHLPRELQPATDLWPGIAARLESRDAVPPSSAPPRTGWGATQWIFQAVAALFFMALGAGLAGIARQVPVDGPSTEPGSSTQVRTVAYSGAEPVDPVLAELQDLERDYRQARDALWLYLLEHEQDLPSGVLKVVEKNVRIIDDAGSQILAALAHDPGNPELQRRLWDNRRRSLEILRSLSRRV